MKSAAKKYKEALEDMVNQFAYPCSIGGIAHITTGGLSALELAFEVLDYPDPKPVPEHQCQFKDCSEYATCGIPTKQGYKRVCGKHFKYYNNKRKSS